MININRTSVNEKLLALFTPGKKVSNVIATEAQVDFTSVRGNVTNFKLVTMLISMICKTTKHMTSMLTVY